MEEDKTFASNYQNAYKVVSASFKMAKAYKHIHFWEQPNTNTFNEKLCKELNMPPTSESVFKILVVVNEWNIHEVLKGLFKGKQPNISLKRKQLTPVTSNTPLRSI